MEETPDRIEERLVIRIAPERKERVRKAAEYLGQTVTTFTLRSLDKNLAAVEAEMAQTEEVAA